MWWLTSCKVDRKRLYLRVSHGTIEAIQRTTSALLSGRQSAHEADNSLGDFARSCLKGKVSGVNKVDLRTRLIAAKCLTTRRQKERVILAPDGQQWRTSFTK